MLRCINPREVSLSSSSSTWLASSLVACGEELGWGGDWLQCQMQLQFLPCVGCPPGQGGWYPSEVQIGRGEWVWMREEGTDRREGRVG